MAKELNGTAKRDLTYLHMGIVLLIMIIFQIIPPIAPITTVGMKLTGVFLGMLYGWTTCGMLMPSFVGLLAMSFTGLMPTVTQVISTAFSAEPIIFCLFIFILVELLNDCGFIKVLTNWLLTRDVLKGRVWLLVTALFFISALITMTGQAFAAMFFVWEMWYGIFRQAGYEPGEKFPTLMVVGTVLVMSAGGIIIPFMGVPIVIMSAYGSIVHETVNFAKYIMVVLPIGILMFAEVILIFKYIFKPDISRLANLDIQTMVTDENLKMTKRQKVIAGYFVAVIILLFLPGILPRQWAIVALLSHFGNAGTCILAVVLLMLIKVEGTPLMDFRRIAQKAVNWDIIFFLSVILLMASLLVSPETGVSAFLTQMLRPLLGIGSPYLFVAIFVFAACLLTNVLNNMIVGVLFLPLIGAASVAMGLNSWAILVLVIIGVHFSVLTPAASPAAGIMFANKEWLKSYGEVFKYAAVVFIAWSITLITVGVGLANLIF